MAVWIWDWMRVLMKSKGHPAKSHINPVVNWNMNKILLGEVWNHHLKALYEFVDNLSQTNTTTHPGLWIMQ